MSESENAVLFCFLSLLLIIVSYELKKKFSIPVCPCLVIAGLIFRLIGRYNSALSKVIDMIDGINLEVIQFVLLPGIIFNAAYKLDWYTFKKLLGQTVPLATTVIITSAVFTGISFQYILCYDYSWNESFMFGIIMNATDNVSIKSLFKEVHIHGKLENLLKGESVLSAGTVLVVFKVLRKVLKNSPELTIILAIRAALGGVFFGIIFAVALGMILKRFVNDYLQETNIIIVTVYLSYWITEYSMDSCGGAAMVVLGLYMSAYGKTFISPTVQHKFSVSWNIMVNNIEGLIFVSAGVILGRFLTDYQYLQGYDIGMAVSCFVILHVIRWAVLLLHYPFLKYFGYGVTLTQITLMTFAGIKGVLSSALGLMIYNDNVSDEDYRTTLLFFAITISTLSIVIDSIIVKIIAKKWKMGEVSDVQKNILLGVTTSIIQDTSKIIENLQNDGNINLVKWDEVQQQAGPKLILKEFMKQSEFGRELFNTHSNASTEQIIQIYNQHLNINENVYKIEIRRRYYSTVKGLYWKSYEKGECYASTVLHLINVCNSSLDKDSFPMKDWEDQEPVIYNKKRIAFYKKWSDSPLFGKIFRRLVYDNIIKAYDVALAFTRAHYKAKGIMDKMEQEVHRENDEDIEQDAYESIIEEAHAQIFACQKFIKEYITDTYPDIIAEVQTKMACFLLLNRQRKQITFISQQGVIKEQEFAILNSSITSNLKDLTFMSKPEIPTLEIMLKKRFKKTKIEEIKKVLHLIEEKHFNPETVLFNESSKAEGAYLIFSGIVREFNEVIDYDLTKDNIVGAINLIPGFQDFYTTTAITRTVAIAAFIPINTLNDFFIEDIYQESANQFALLHKQKFGLENAQNSHIIKVVENSKVLHLYSGSALNLRRGALVLKGRIRKEKEIFSLLRPSKKIIESLEESIVLIFPPHFGTILKQHLLLSDAFASYYIKAKTKNRKNTIIQPNFSIKSLFKINQLDTTAEKEELIK